jgi:hypothetical protein
MFYILVKVKLNCSSDEISTGTHAAYEKINANEI